MARLIPVGILSDKSRDITCESGIVLTDGIQKEKRIQFGLKCIVTSEKFNQRLRVLLDMPGVLPGIAV